MSATPHPATAAAAVAATPGLADDEVVARVRDGDAPLFEVLMRRYNQRLYRLVRPLLGDDDEAADVLQEAWVRAYQHLDQFAGRARFSTWVSKIAIYQAYARTRARRRLVPVATVDEAAGEAAFTPTPVSPESASEHRELADLLRAAVERLPAPLRLVFVLRAIEELSTQETAEVLAISPQNVKVRLHRARAALRGDLERRLGAEASRLYGFDGDRCDAIVAGVLARLGIG
ncbi:MAG TPA: RNA polymerase sigma factor [Thermoanaerobaculia bacterium]|jgi:RNA polymerase sigma-70 factor (ECF subfamily)|nr:RNA polymerase sigma factor [Thermoanaerobaculia bacterium]